LKDFSIEKNKVGCLEQSMGKNITDRQLFVGGDRAMEELHSLVGGQSSIELSVGGLPLPFGFVFVGGLLNFIST